LQIASKFLKNIFLQTFLGPHQHLCAELLCDFLEGQPIEILPSGHPCPQALNQRNPFVLLLPFRVPKLSSLPWGPNMGIKHTLHIHNFHLLLIVVLLRLVPTHLQMGITEALGRLCIPCDKGVFLLLLLPSKWNKGSLVTCTFNCLLLFCFFSSWVVGLLRASPFKVSIWEDSNGGVLCIVLIPLPLVVLTYSPLSTIVSYVCKCCLLILAPLACTLSTR
jgi:hypothetical protein